MKTPSVNDQKPRRDNPGPTGPAVVDEGKGRDTGERSGGGDGSYEKEIEHILDRKRAQTPPG
jgi:hypothetical protein